VFEICVPKGEAHQLIEIVRPASLIQVTASA
jgi:hypothetical protein